MRKTTIFLFCIFLFFVVPFRGFTKTKTPPDIKKVIQQSQEASSLLRNIPGIEDYDVMIHVSWNYSREYLYQTPDERVEEKFEFMAKKDYVGLLRRSLKEISPNYWFDWTKPEPLLAQTIAYQSFSHSSEATTRCNLIQRKDKEDLGLTGQGGELKNTLLAILDGAAVELTCHCISQHKTDEGIETERETVECSSSEEMGLVITPNDLDQLLKEQYWSKTYSGFFEIDQMLTEADPKKLPQDKIIIIKPEEGTTYRGEVKIEISLGPPITGPHYLAYRKQNTGQTQNEITLRAEPLPEWQITSPIEIKKGREFVEIVRQTSPPSPILTVKGKKPGKVELGMRWVSPKGKRGTSPPFELTVVQLEFKKTERCKGFDDGPERRESAPAVSVCTNAQKDIIEVTIEPKGVSIPTTLEPKDAASFSASPSSFSNFPRRVILTGILKKRSLLTAKVKIDETQTQTAAEMFVDVLDPSPLKVLPVVLTSREFITPHIDLMFNGAKEDLYQACVELKRMPNHFLAPAQVPRYQDGERLLYDGAGEEVLKNFARRKLMKGQDLTAFFVPDIATEVLTPQGPIYDPNPQGYQTEVFVFVKTTSDYPHLFAHEMGHFLFRDRYLSGSMDETNFHTQDSLMLMHYYTGDGCEIRQEEWRDLHP